MRPPVRGTLTSWLPASLLLVPLLACACSDGGPAGSPRPLDASDAGSADARAAESGDGAASACAAVPSTSACRWDGTWTMRLALAPVEPQACPGTQHRDSAATLELDLRVDARGDAICADGAAYASLVLSDEGCTLVATTFTREWRNPSEYGSEVAAARLEMKAGEVTASYTRSERGFFFCDRVWRGTATRAPR